MLTFLQYSYGIIPFFVGAIPFASLIASFKKIDLRRVGSGNVGATNVYRALGWKFGILVFLLDGAKGYFPVYVGTYYSDNPWVHIGVGALTVLGHSFSPFLKFKGGKGAATTAGVLCALAPDVFGILFAVGLMLILAFRYVALTSIVCGLLAPLLLYLFDYSEAYVGIMTLLSVLILIKHRSNILRLIQKKENKI